MELYTPQYQVIKHTNIDGSDEYSLHEFRFSGLLIAHASSGYLLFGQPAFRRQWNDGSKAKHGGDGDNKPMRKMTVNSSNAPRMISHTMINSDF
jgi:hypothetical protein